MERDSGRTVEVDAREWRYVLHRFPDGTFDVVVEQAGLRGVTKDDRARAAVIAVEAEVGERLRLEHLPRIEAVESLAADLSARATPIRHLAAHLRALFHA